MDSYKTLTVDSKTSTHLGYLDSGAPLGTSPYTTIFVIHGLAFTAKIFSKVISVAPKHGIRIVAISRRDYPGSSPLGAEDIGLMVGSDEEKAVYLTKRGLEYLTFVNTFIQEHKLPDPSVSEGRQTGGVALLSWSLGNAFGNAALASVSKLEPEARERVTKHLHTIIIEDPPALALGLPMPEKTWGPAWDTQIPEHERVSYQVLWLTSWFDHGDLSKHDLNDLTYALPSRRKAPSIYTMHEHYDELVHIPPIVMGVEGESPPGTDAMLMGLLATHLKENYERVVFGDGADRLLPNATIQFLGRAHSGTFSISAYWQVQGKNEKRGGPVNFEMTPHNHFLHWEEPETAIASWTKALAQIKEQ